MQPNLDLLSSSFWFTSHQIFLSFFVFFLSFFLFLVCFLVSPIAYQYQQLYKRFKNTIKAAHWIQRRETSGARRDALALTRWAREDAPSATGLCPPPHTLFRSLLCLFSFVHLFRTPTPTQIDLRDWISVCECSTTAMSSMNANSPLHTGLEPKQTTSGRSASALTCGGSSLPIVFW